MADPDPPDDAAERESAKSHRLRARHRNERLRMIAGAVDRLGTVILGGAVLAPIFQMQPIDWRRTGAWIIVALVLHLVALYLIGRQKEEE
jgi:hypothetical protein